MTQITNVLLLVAITFILSLGATFLTIFIDKVIDLHALVKKIPLMLDYNDIISYNQ